jgi:hypothetical protein
MKLQDIANKRGEYEVERESRTNKEKVIDILNKYFKTFIADSHYEEFSKLVYEELKRENLLKWS